MELFSSFYLILAIIFFFSLLFLMKPKTRTVPSYNNLPPSPPGLPIIGNMLQLGKLPHVSLWKLSKKHGPVMLLHFGQVRNVVISSSEMAKAVLQTHDLDCCSRPYTRGTAKLSYNLLDVAFSPYTEYSRSLRKLCVMELFALKRVQSFWNVREKYVAQLISSISESTPSPIELNQYIFPLTNAMICSTAFGKAAEGSPFSGYDSVQDALNEAVAMLMSSFWAADCFPKFGWIVDVMAGMRRRLDKIYQNFDVFFESLIDEHLNPSRPKPEQEDLIDVLLGISKNDMASFRLTRDHIKGILMDILVGGIDTVSTTILWVMTELVRNPRVMKKVQTEIRSCVGRKPKVSEDEIPQLSYLKNVVKETLRLHPPAPLLLPRESLRPCKIGGYDIPAKSLIRVNAWAIGRDPETWKNPWEFCPERFEDNDVDFRGNRFQLIPFGGGRRMCPGMTMGLIGVELTLANLLHCFNWQLPEGMKPEDISAREAIDTKHVLRLVPIKYDWSQQ